MQQWKCSTCNEFHQELLMDIAFEKPQQYLDINSEERGTRIWVDAESNTDLCIIDESIFLIRSFLPLKVEDGRFFRFGVWVKVAKEDFLIYYKTQWNLEDPPTFSGEIANLIPGYSQLEKLQVDVQLIEYTDRPAIIIHSSEHQLAIEQRVGITLIRVHEIIQTCLPKWFG